MKVKVGLIGCGTIGKEVEKRVLQRGWIVPVIARTSGIYDSEGKKIDVLSNWLEHFKEVDIVVLCIPTNDDGVAAYYYIKNLVEKGIPVVTSEKGALGNYFPELKSQIAKGKIGYSAVVGGGTRLLHWAKERISSDTMEIHLVINASLNFTFDGLSWEKTLEEVVEEAKKLRYVEPGAQEPIEIINAEAGKDVPLKTAAFINLCGLGEIRAREIEVQNISEKDLRKLIKEAAFRRYIVSITRKEEEEDIIRGFKFKINDWYVSAGFKYWALNPLFSQLIPSGANNAALIYGPDGIYVLTGPGAGPTPTVLGGIMWDLENILEI